MFKIWCVLLAGTFGAFAQAPKSENVSMATGRLWEAMPETTKLFYVVGIKDGLTIAAYSLPPDVRELMMEHTVVDPIFWTEKRPFLRWSAALKMKESQCPKPARVTRPA
jgi:hypothetical protein